MVEASLVLSEPSTSSSAKTEEEIKRAKEEFQKRLKSFANRKKIKGARAPKTKLFCKICDGGVSDHDSESEDGDSPKRGN